MSFLSLLRPDRFTVALVASAIAATVIPATGPAASILKMVIVGSIALLFFLQGARLSQQAIIQGVIHWRLHLMVFAATFILFPVLGLLTQTYLQSYLAPGIGLGILYLCLLPSTIQSSITFTSIAGGNVAAAVCSASASNVLGVFLTPLLMGLFMQTQGGVSVGAIGEIVVQILVPFVVGHLMRPGIGRWVERRRTLTGIVDRGAILLVVYYAFGEATIKQLWTQLEVGDLLLLVLISCCLLAAVLVLTTVASRLVGFAKQDEIALVFCGSKKSLGSGVPIASILFPASMIGAIILPLMLFHQIQLLVCAVLARSYAERSTLRPSHINS